MSIFNSYVVNDGHHVPQLSAGEDRRQDVPHCLPPLSRHHGQHLHEVLVRLRVRLYLPPIDEVIEVFDHHALGQLQITDDKDGSSKRTVRSDNLIVGVVGVNVVCDVGEPDVAPQHVPSSFSPEREMSWLLFNSFRSKIGKLLLHPKVTYSKQANQACKNVQPHF